jgi:hypothetical protein
MVDNCAILLSPHQVVYICTENFVVCQQSGFYTNYNIPEVRVDPDGRCAAMHVYGSHMVILPFRRDVMAEEGDNLAGARYLRKDVMYK